MAKILILANNDLGLYNFRRELIEKLISDGHKVIISLPYGDRVGDLVELGCVFREMSIDRHGTNPIKELKLISKYKKLIKEEKPDFVFTYTIKPNIYGAIACRKYKVPCIVNITGLGNAVEKKGLMQKVCVILYKYALKKVKKVFFQNAENMQFFIDNKIVVNKHDLLPGSGVNLQRFTVKPYPTNTDISFAFIARIMKEKGIEEYLETAKTIKGKYPNTVFHICGYCEQDYEEELKNLHSENVVNYHGLIKDVHGFLENVHCVVLPSYHEGMSNTLLESSASARPIITSDCAGCREAVDEGVNGYLVKVKDTNGLINAVEKFILLSNDERAKMGLLGREKVEREFDRKIVVNKYLDEINS